MQLAIPSQMRSQGSATDIELGETPQMSWERFKELFNRKFFPTYGKLVRAREFMSLCQGPNMLVAQYKAEFLLLIKYMSLYGMDDVDKGRNFLQGLQIELQQLISLVHVESYVDIVFKAIIAEENMMRVAELKATIAQNGEQSEKSNPTSGPLDRRIQKKGNACFKCKKRHPSKRCNSQRFVCYTCG